MERQSNIIGNYVHEKRAAKGLNLPQVAKMTGVAPSTVSRIESGEMLPSIPTLLRLSEAVDLDLYALLATLGARTKGDLPEFEDYLRQKYGISEVAIAQIASYFRERHLGDGGS